MESILDGLRRTEGYRKTLAALRQGRGPFRLAGLYGSSRALFATALRADLGRPLACVTAGTDEADDLASDLAALGPDDPPAAVWPLTPADPDPLALSAPPRETLEALSILRDLAEPAPPLLVIPAPALLHELAPPGTLIQEELALRVGEPADLEEVVRRLAAAGLDRTVRVEAPLTFARRGGIVDCFVPARAERGERVERPLRIEWDGDVVRSLRFFDPVTQESTGAVRETRLTLPPQASVPRGKACLLDHLKPGTVVLLVDPAETRRRLANLDADPGTRGAFRPGDVESRLASRALVELREESFPQEASASFPVKSLVRFSVPLEEKMKILGAFARAKAPFHLFVRREAEEARFRTLLAEHRVRWEALAVHPGRLARGFQLADGPVLVSYDEIFQIRAPHRPAKIPAGIRDAARAIEDLAELSPGDLVVHEHEGIAIYRGLARLSKGDVDAEHLKLEFAEGTTLFVPTDDIGLVSRYVGSGIERPPLSRLGGAQWRKAKAAAAKATQELAGELLRIQALRQTHPASPLVPDPGFAAAFDAAFPYPPTKDQEEAAAAIARDLAAAVPMDRLLCGDVGFGKTEVAMRAAFRAVACGKQVAVLAPTTVLALQHAKSFRERFAAFPVRIDMVSRLKPPRDQRKTIAEAKAGRVDILIGTHRLLSKDVAFEDLGLLVVDEEQKFGVKHKARLRQMRAALHVLSLSATPIPRTLHEALLGIKEISNLTTPPLDRRSIATQVGRYDEALVKRAVQEELARDGQVFLVHNRIAGLTRLRRDLARLAPSARVGIAHGKLSAHEIEAVMLDLAERRIDVLLSTTIIESGVDFPNVNTLIVTDAHRYGLAELHQLRGRVGRFKRQAYAYLLVPPHETVTPAAMRRLKAIEEFSELGAGFQIALADLEIRGAGNLLGPEQSGHIAAIGYDLYCRLLEESGRALRGEPAAAPRAAASVRLLGESLLPDDYIAAPTEKFGLYKKLARAKNEDDLDRAVSHIADRFGPPPAAAQRLFAAARLRVLATAAGVLAIEEKKDAVEIRDGLGTRTVPRETDWIETLSRALRKKG